MAQLGTYRVMLSPGECDEGGHTRADLQQLSSGLGFFSSLCFRFEPLR
jgi:hypothetical protein